MSSKSKFDIEKDALVESINKSNAALDSLILH